MPLIAPKYLKNNIMQLKAHTTPKECFQRTFLSFKNGLQEYEDNFVKTFNDEMKCNSFVHFRGAKNLCKKYKSDPQFTSVASYFYIRGFSESDFHRVFEIENFCDDTINFKEHGGTQ